MSEEKKVDGTEKVRYSDEELQEFKAIILTPATTLKILLRLSR